MPKKPPLLRQYVVPAGRTLWRPRDGLLQPVPAGRRTPAPCDRPAGLALLSVPGSCPGGPGSHEPDRPGRGGPRLEIAPLNATASLARLQAGFLSVVPHVERHARVHFRGIRCPHARADAVAEAVAIAWRWFVCLARRGKDPTQFARTLVAYAVRHVRSGRRLCGQEKAKDVLSPLAQRRKGFCVVKLPDCSTLTANPLAEALVDNMQTPPDQQACFRLDFPAWLTSLERRNRALAVDMAMGHRTRELASGYRISPARLSQLRREFHDDWVRFCGDGLERWEGPCRR
jgi:hypothetical protein